MVEEQQQRPAQAMRSGDTQQQPQPLGEFQVAAELMQLARQAEAAAGNPPRAANEAEAAWVHRVPQEVLERLVRQVSALQQLSAHQSSH